MIWFLIAAFLVMSVPTALVIAGVIGRADSHDGGLTHPDDCAVCLLGVSPSEDGHVYAGHLLTDITPMEF